MPLPRLFVQRILILPQGILLLYLNKRNTKTTLLIVKLLRQQLTNRILKITKCRKIFNVIITIYIFIYLKRSLDIPLFHMLIDPL